jgi:hypothetical protein
LGDLHQNDKGAANCTAIHNCEFVFNLEYEKAVAEYEEILKAGIGKIYFGWIGSYEESKRHYYVLNGPTFIIEFDNCALLMGKQITFMLFGERNEFGEDVLKNITKWKSINLAKHKPLTCGLPLCWRTE